MVAVVYTKIREEKSSINKNDRFSRNLIVLLYDIKYKKL